MTVVSICDAPGARVMPINIFTTFDDPSASTRACRCGRPVHSVYRDPMR